MAAYEKLAKLAYKLHQMTDRGKISWQETMTAGVYQASFSDYSVQISIEQSGREPVVRIGIFGTDGNELESFTDEELSPEWLSEFEGIAGAFGMMYGTYQTARRVALGTEKAINQILSALEYDDEIPF